MLRRDCSDSELVSWMRMTSKDDLASLTVYHEFHAETDIDESNWTSGFSDDVTHSVLWDLGKKNESFNVNSEIIH